MTALLLRACLLLALCLLLPTESSPARAHATGGAASWQDTGRMTVGRISHTAVRLPDGQVLVAGGSSGGPGPDRILRSAERYDPATGTWSLTGSMTDARVDFTMTELHDGRVLVAGGSGGDPGATRALASAELYDPVTGRWSATGMMTEARVSHTATRLADGRVLVVGGIRVDGFPAGALASAELYDPARGTWSATASLTVARFNHAAVRLADGRVLVVGGIPSTAEPATATAERYDPATGTWSAAEPLTIARATPLAERLTDGRVLVAGGDSRGEAATTAELYDPASDTWSMTGNLASPHGGGMLSLLADGRVLVVGGFVGSMTIIETAELYEPTTGEWRAAASMHRSRARGTLTLLDTGWVLVAGGVQGFGEAADPAAAERYGPP